LQQRPKQSPQRRVLILVENLPSPFDRRVWQEATTLRAAGYGVSIICPTGKGCEKKFESIDGIDIWRYDLPTEAEGALGYLIEYSAALAWTFFYSLRIKFDVVHACNPPDLFFLIGGFYKLFGKKFLFDHHDANPELYEAKFGRRDFFWKVMCFFERLTFRYRRRLDRHQRVLPPHRARARRHGPGQGVRGAQRPEPGAHEDRSAVGRSRQKYLVGYVGVMGKQEGIDLLCSRSHLVLISEEDIHSASSAAAPRSKR
jgi:hypothetical protein